VEIASSPTSWPLRYYLTEKANTFKMLQGNSIRYNNEAKIERRNARFSLDRTFKSACTTAFLLDRSNTYQLLTQAWKVQCSITVVKRLWYKPHLNHHKEAVELIFPWDIYIYTLNYSWYSALTQRRVQNVFCFVSKTFSHIRFTWWHFYSCSEHICKG